MTTRHDDDDDDDDDGEEDEEENNEEEGDLELFTRRGVGREKERKDVRQGSQNSRRGESGNDTECIQLLGEFDLHERSTSGSHHHFREHHTG